LKLNLTCALADPAHHSTGLAVALGQNRLDCPYVRGLQGEAAKFVSRVEGDPDTVIGMPVKLVRTLLAAAGQGGGLIRG